MDVNMDMDAAMGMDMDMDGDMNTDMDMDTDTFIPTIYSPISDWNTECRMSDLTDILFKVSNPSIITYRSTVCLIFKYYVLFFFCLASALLFILRV
jgi:hypothetical protein